MYESCISFSDEVMSTLSDAHWGSKAQPRSMGFFVHHAFLEETRDENSLIRDLMIDGYSTDSGPRAMF